jgi:hypothetical protein
MFNPTTLSFSICTCLNSIVADELEHGMFDDEEPDEHVSLLHKVKGQHVPMDRQVSAVSHHSKSSHYDGTDDKEEASFIPVMIVVYRESVVDPGFLKRGWKAYVKVK